MVFPSPTTNTLDLLWAKTDRAHPHNPTRFHPLICHLIDVGMVAEALWRDSLSQGVRKRIARQLNLSVDDAGRTISYWAALHDLGKASPAFQWRWKPGLDALRKHGAPFDLVTVTTRKAYHALITTVLLRRYSREAGANAHLPNLMMGRSAARAVGRAIGGHHGLWPTDSAMDDQSLATTDIGVEPFWVNAHQMILDALQTVFQPSHVDALGSARLDESALILFVSGITAVADWLGSMEQHLRFCPTPVDMRTYPSLSCRAAQQTVGTEGWRFSPPASSQINFADFFGFAPNPLQARLIDLAPQLDEPALLIIETPTGSGKTEGAFLVADTLMQQHEQRGLYIAMPTAATSNQMFQRTLDYLTRRSEGQSARLRLLHSQAQWLGSPISPINVDVDAHPEDDTSNERELNAQTWFLPAKRGLLEQMAVGTVDQAFLGVLQARHFFVRLWGLMGKTIIFDEVHAYDTYMSTLFERLLAWLHAIGSSAIILSATLPASTRRRLVDAYLGKQASAHLGTNNAYPGLTAVFGQQMISEPIPWHEQRTVLINKIEPNPASIADLLLDKLSEGGAAAVICNTVGRAQDLYRTLKPNADQRGIDLLLFHARFPLNERNEIERKVLRTFGKRSKSSDPSAVELSSSPAEHLNVLSVHGVRRPTILIATQVIEQSLDLDFDFMISDLAPIDLLIQRAGRLHRHLRHRPPALREPTFFVALDVGADGVPMQQADRFYDRKIMLLTWFTLQSIGIDAPSGSSWTTPRDTAALIEAVYGDSPNLALSDLQQFHLRKAQEEYENDQNKARGEASSRLVKDPAKEDVMQLSGLERIAENPSVHADMQALTRLGPPSLQLVCLFRSQDGLNTRSDGSGQTIALDEVPDVICTSELILNSVSITNPTVYWHFVRQPPPPGWARHPLLRHTRVAEFEATGYAAIGETSFALHLDKVYGLRIEKGTSP